MISILDSLSELEKSYALAESNLACCRLLAQGLADLSLEMGDPATDTLGIALQQAAESMISSDAISLPNRARQTSVLIKDYGKSVQDCVIRMRREQSATERVLQELTASLQQSDDDHDGRIRTTVDHLRIVSRTPEARALREVLGTAAQTIEQSVERIQKEHQTAIARFHREIRDLQRQLNPEGGGLTQAPSLHLITREQFSAWLTQARTTKFRILLMRARGIRLAREQFERDVAEQLTTGFVVRLRNLLPFTTAIAQWNEEQFVALLPPDSGSPGNLCRTITQSSSGAYACMHSERTVRPAIEVTICSMDPNNDTPVQLIDRIDSAIARI